jgi:hypothetical protein
VFGQRAGCLREPRQQYLRQFVRERCDESHLTIRQLNELAFEEGSVAGKVEHEPL